MSTNLLWKCPDCGAGLRAPTRMRVRDVRRYCLPCSGKTGFLVLRTSSVLEKRREDKALARRERARVARLLKGKRIRQELEFRETLCGIPVLKWMRDKGLDWPARLRLRTTRGPGPLIERETKDGSVQQWFFYFRRGDWMDEYDVYAQALVLGVRLSRFWRESISKGMQRVYLRDQAEAILGVRPRLDSMPRAPVEIAALLRKRAAAKTLSGVSERVA